MDPTEKLKTENGRLRRMCQFFSDLLIEQGKDRQMLNKQFTEEEKERELSEHKLKSNLVLLPGGKDGDENWLAKLEEGTIFLARSMKTERHNPIVEQFEIKRFTDTKKHAMLLANEHMQGIEILVNTLIFSRQYEFGEILAKVVTEDESGV